MLNNKLKYWTTMLLLVFSLICAGTISYSLWWQRDRVLYFDKTDEEQRDAVFDRAGLDKKTIYRVIQYAGAWPKYSHYSIQCGEREKSYIQYLLAPRIPDGDSSHNITVKDEWVTVRPGPEKTTVEDPPVIIGILGLAISLLSVFGAGFLFHFYSREKSTVAENCITGALILMIAVLMSKHILSRPFIGFVLFSSAGLAGMYLWVYSLFKRTGEDLTEKTRKDFRFFFASFVLICGIALSLAMAVIVVPDDWDAWAIWGAKAKVIAIGIGSIKDVIYFGHPDYPLMWPSIWAYSSWCSGGWEEQWAKGWGSILYALCAIQIFNALIKAGRSAITAVTVSALFATIPMVVVISSWAYAEPLLWLAMTCSFSRVLEWQRNGRKKDLFFAGLYAVASVFAKNEGLLFAAVLIPILILTKTDTYNQQPGRLRLVSKIKTLIIFALPFLLYLPWAFWVRKTMDLKSAALTGFVLSPENIHRALSRFIEAMRMIWGISIDPRLWGSAGILLVIGAVMVIVKGRYNERLNLLLPILMILGYFVIILFHEADLSWQIGTSWNRLLAQTLPLFAIVVASVGWRCCENDK